MFSALSTIESFSRAFLSQSHVFSCLSLVFMLALSCQSHFCCHSATRSAITLVLVLQSTLFVFPPGKYLSTSLMLSDTDEDSDAESTVFEVKKRHMNGSVNGYIRKDT